MDSNQGLLPLHIFFARLFLFGCVGLGAAGCGSVVPDAESSDKLTAAAPTSVRTLATELVGQSEGGVSFLAFGDAGYVGSDSSLSNVALTMRQHCQSYGCDFAMVAGDNIYPKGADGAVDRSSDLARFQTVFIDPFGDFQKYTSADFRFYMALGNHDWYTSREGAFAQIAFHEQTPPFYMNGPFYSVLPTAGQGTVEVFVLDTEMLLAPVMVDTVNIAADGVVRRTGGKKPAGWKDALPFTGAEKGQLQWFKNALVQSTADWKIVLAHHPLWESKGSKFAQAEALREMVLPTLCTYADAWFAGHQHTLEVHEIGCPAPGRSFAQDSNDELPTPSKALLHVVSGAVAKARPVSAAFGRWQAATYPALNSLFVAGDTQGFVYAKIEDDGLQLRVYGAPASSQSPDDVHELFAHRFDRRSATQ